MSVTNQQQPTLLECPQPLPHIWAKEEIVLQMKSIISKLQAVKENVVKNVSIEAATFDTVVRPILEVENATIHENGGTIWMQQYGSSDLTTQEAVVEARRLIIEHESLGESNEELFQLLLAARKRGDDLDRESKLWLDKALIQCRIAGCGSLDQSEKDQLIKETLELEKLCIQAQGNIAHESGGVWFTEAELDGVPAADLERFKKHDNNKNTETKRDKEIFVAFTNGGQRSVITNATSPETRRRMYLENEKAFAPNIPLMQEIVERRQKRAQLLGFASHAHLKMENRLLKSPEQVRALIDSSRAGLQARATQELSVLRKRRRRDLGDGAFPPWDRLYYQRLVQEERNYDAEAFAEYFPVDTVPAAMLGVFESYLGLSFVEIPKEEIGKDKIWHESVSVFAVWDVRRPEREFVGYLYFDLLWRENKFRGAHNVTLEFGYEKVDGSRKYPSTILMSAFPAADDTGCALLKHPDVVVVFHELGHAIHNLVSKTKYFRFHGTNLPPDFVEMPSLMLENWCWMPEVLASLSTHYAHVRPEYRARWQAKNPGAPLPPRRISSEMIEARVKYRFANEATWFLGQLAISQYDLTLHSATTAEAAKAIDVQQLWYDIHAEMLEFDYSECRAEGADMVSFHHLVRGYDMAYYSYPCCLIFATELFENVFSQDPSSKDAWERYRTGVLEYGGGHPDLLQLLRDLLGHEPTGDPLVKMLNNAEL